jgi:two-component system, cell cycle response regulator
LRGFTRPDDADSETFRLERNVMENEISAETNVLVIEDSDSIRKQIVQTLQENSVAKYIHEAGDGIEGIKILLDIKIDLVLCDVEMPRLDGFRFLSMVHARDEIKEIPVILLTGKEDQESKIKGFSQGAADYITKPFDSGELLARVKVHLKLKKLKDELCKANELLRELSNTDHLTGLFNRRYLMEVMDREYSRAFRSRAPLSLMILDIDHFKNANDRFGHQEGDAILARVATIFRQELRGYDTPVRFGGDEYVAVLPNTGVDDALVVAERIKRAVAENRFSGKLAGLKITVSIGVASFPCQGIESVEDLIREADGALYRAKAGGRNRVERVDSTLQP